MFRSIALYAVAAGAIFSAGMFYQMYRTGQAVVKDQQEQATGVEKLHKGELRSAVKTVKVVTYIKSAPDSTGCGKVKMRSFDIDALGGL